VKATAAAPIALTQSLIRIKVYENEVAVQHHPIKPR
jgi:hypothetical protein